MASPVRNLTGPTGLSRMSPVIPVPIIRINPLGYATGVMTPRLPSLTQKATLAAGIDTPAIKIPPPPMGRLIFNTFPAVYRARPAITITLDVSSKDIEDQKDRAWRDQVGYPARWMVHSGGKIRVVPIPSQQTVVRVGYLDVPAELAEPTDTPDARIPAGHHGYLKFAAAAWLLRMDGDAGDEQKAQAFMQTFNSLIGAKD